MAKRPAMGVVKKKPQEWIDLLGGEAHRLDLGPLSVLVLRSKPNPESPGAWVMQTTPDVVRGRYELDAGKIERAKVEALEHLVAVFAGLGDDIQAAATAARVAAGGKKLPGRASPTFVHSDKRRERE